MRSILNRLLRLWSGHGFSSGGIVPSESMPDSCVGCQGAQLELARGVAASRCPKCGCFWKRSA